ncbi:hypothetical protein JJL45_05980 [Tamlana sp. s12]|uniref:hypothetical protein n=1 Tax=Tamlana sp. s12 TaxID=1630406 RepID=UPI0007FED032|nr:hypothetical protein [Tamlana sp. s12]OBQ55952.1 hypothetical protein VQ01_06080 [Tamlana sp. s12]QQY83543.1 hypothetical protein JJL45_05980 [Tamlana sp. s12]
MKKVIWLTLGLMFSAFTMSAQLPISSSDLKSISTTTKLSESQTEKVEKALLTDEDLQSKTIDYLKSNPETSKSVLDLASKSSGNTDLMKSILGNNSLATYAIDYISKNPKLLKQALKVVGL